MDPDPVAIRKATCYSFSRMAESRPKEAREPGSSYGLGEALSPFKKDAWLHLTPAQRLERSWRLRARLPDPQAIHDRKLFPKP